MCEVQSTPPYCSGDKFNAFIEYIEDLDDSGDESPEAPPVPVHSSSHLFLQPPINLSHSSPYHSSTVLSFHSPTVPSFHPSSSPSHAPTQTSSSHSPIPPNPFVQSFFEFADPSESQHPYESQPPTLSGSPSSTYESQPPPLHDVPSSSPDSQIPPPTDDESHQLQIPRPSSPSASTSHLNFSNHPIIEPSLNSPENNRVVDSFHLPYDGQSGHPSSKRGIASRRGTGFSSDPHRHYRRISSICNLGSLITSLILSICTAANQRSFPLNKEDRSRLQFLKDTVDLITEYVSNQDDGLAAFHPYDCLLALLSDRMSEVCAMLQRIQHQTSKITQNFDIFELKLRGHLDELTKMFPLGDISMAWTPTRVIDDSQARLAWERHHGLDVHMVPFSRFLSMLQHEGLLSSAESPARNRFVLFLRYFVDFPSQDLVTTYKWSLLIRLFGPFETFSKTFADVVARRGFLGLVNRIQAYELLTLSHQPRTLLIRLSRTEPDFLAFSYKNSEGQIGHQINKDRKTGLPIPVSTFLQTKFPNYSLLNKTLDVEKILVASKHAGSSLEEYASASTGYILSSPSDSI